MSGAQYTPVKMPRTSHGAAIVSGHPICRFVDKGYFASDISPLICDSKRRQNVIIFLIIIISKAKNVLH